ncbi:MAG: redoxin domain-containing protein, partial [Candidatus Altimarinota bacterium]
EEQAIAKGKWKLLFFYPADFTTVCPTECLALKEFYSAFESLNTEVIGISTDPVNIHKAWVAYYFGPLPYPLLADTNHKLASMFDFWSEEEGVALRGTVILNPENKIVFMSAQENNTGRNVEEYIRMLTAIQTPGLKTEDWQAGESTL